MTFSPSARRLLFWLPVVILVMATLVWSFRPQPLLVEAAVVDRGPVRVTVEAEGTTRAREIFEVSAPVAGRLLRMDLEVGDAVRRGVSIVAHIRPTVPSLLDVRTRRQIEAELKAAEAALDLAAAEQDRAEAELDFAKSEFDRAQRLVRRGTISEAALERAALDVKTARARIASAIADRAVKRFEAETVRARLMEGTDGSGDDVCCVEVPAPLDGVVLRVIRESETIVGSGAPLLELGDPTDLEVVVDVLSRDAVRLEQGASVSLSNWGGDGELAGRIDRIEPFAFTEVSALGIEEQRVNVIVTLTDPPMRWRRLGHGFRLDASLVVWSAEDVVRVPTTAMFRDDQGRWRVFRVAEGRALSTPLEIGHIATAHAEVLGGLEAGDVVIRFPSNRVGDGSRVAARRF